MAYTFPNDPNAAPIIVPLGTTITTRSGDIVAKNTTITGYQPDQHKGGIPLASLGQGSK
jgi:hypothetical protein